MQKTKYGNIDGIATLTNDMLAIDNLRNKNKRNTPRTPSQSE